MRCTESLAYLTAATHGMTEEAASIRASFDADRETLPAAPPGGDATLLQPAPPVAQTETNWPLLTVRRGFFDGAMAATRGEEGDDRL